jgi:predicted transcriptional regulator
MNDRVRGFLEAWKRTEYAFASTVGVLSLLVWMASRTSARSMPYGGSSLLIGLGLLAGLKHPVRRQIYDHLRLLPGDHFRSVARSLRLAVGTARYHLNALVQDGLIYKQGSNGRTRYYVSGGEAEVNRLYARHWEYRDVRVRVLLTLKRMDGAQPAAIAKVLGISRQLASYHLRCLEKAGRVRRHGVSYRVVSSRR